MHKNNFEVQRGIHWYHGHIGEDTLTALVFRTFQYVPIAFEKFWKQLAKQNSLLPMKPTKIELNPWPSWQIPENYKRAIRRLQDKGQKRHIGAEKKQVVEPDMVIETEDTILIVEAELSHAYEASQLVEQFVIAQQIFFVKEKKIFQLLLNKTLCYPKELKVEIKNLCNSHDIFKEIKPPDSDVLLSDLLWFNWQDVVEILQECLTERKVLTLQRRIIRDTIKTILQIDSGKLFPVKPPHDEIKNLLHLKENINKLNELFEKAFTFEKKYLLNILDHKERIQDFIKCLKDT